MQRDSSHRERGPYPPSFGRSENTHGLTRSHRPSETSERDQSPSQIGQANTQYFFVRSPELENPMGALGGSSMVGQLTAGACTVPDNPGRHPSINILDHDALHDHGDERRNDFEIEGMPQAHGELGADSDLEGFNETTLMGNAYASQVYHAQTTMPNLASQPDPWTPLAGSFQGPMNGSQPMYSPYCPSGYLGSPGMPHQSGYSTPQASNTHSELPYPTGGDNDTTMQDWYAPVSFNGEPQAVSEIPRVSLSPYSQPGYCHGYPVAVTPPDSRYRSGGDFLSANGDANSSNGGLPSTPSAYSDTSASCPGPMCCLHEGCPRKFTGKHRRGTLHRHMRLKHRTGQDSVEQERKYSCYVQGCGKDYMRQDALLKHQRLKHPELRIPPPVPRR